MPEDVAHGIHIAPGDGARIRNPAGGDLVFKARGHETGGALTVWESTAAPGEGPPLHTHKDQDELMYFLEGRFRVKLGAELLDAPPGSVTFVPRGTPHTWQNVAEGTGRLLFLFVPAAPAMETFFERAAEEHPDESVEVPFERLGRDAGMDILGPPLAKSDPLP
jgi:quercetin dioxygenase-like cupin family protein